MRLWALLILWPAGSVACAQTYGILLSGCHLDVYAAGLRFGPSKGMRIGAFMPFFVNSRMVVRAELGLGLFSSQSVGEGGSTDRHLSLPLSLLPCLACLRFTPLNGLALAKPRQAWDTCKVP
jgi:hypothetical protein